MNSKSVIEVHDLTVSYSKKPVLWDIDFELTGGKIIGILGPNGAGKSTLIKAILGLLEADSGFAKLWGGEVKDNLKRIAYVPQKESVDWDFPASVMDVALMGRFSKKSIFSRYTKEDKKLAMQALKKVEMVDFSKRQISELSGGQQQRTFIARALAQEADLYFLDEPFAGVDVSTENQIIQLLKEMKNQGKTILVVHHDLNTVQEYFDDVILLNTALVAYGSVKDTFTPENLEKTYGGKINLIDKIGDLIKQKDFPLRKG